MDAKTLIAFWKHLQEQMRPSLDTFFPSEMIEIEANKFLGNLGDADAAELAVSLQAAKDEREAKAEKKAQDIIDEKANQDRIRQGNRLR